MRHLSSVLFIIAVITSFSASCFAETVVIHDDDTLKIEDIRIRLWGIGAPELRWNCTKNTKRIACGQSAKMALSLPILGHFINWALA